MTQEPSHELSRPGVGAEDVEAQLNRLLSVGMTAIAGRYPVLAQLDTLMEGMQGVESATNGQTDQPGLYESPRSNRAESRFNLNHKVKTTGDRVVQNGVNVLASAEAGVNGSAALFGLVDDLDLDLVPGMADELIMSAVALAPIVRDLRAISVDTATELANNNTTLEQRFDLLRTSAGTANGAVDIEDAVQNVGFETQLGLTVILEVARSPLLGELQKELDAGNFDSQVARVMLRAVLALDPDQRAQLPNGLGSLSRIIRFAHAINPELANDDQATADVLASNMSEWSKESLVAVAKSRQALSDSLTKAVRRARSEYADILVPEPSTDWNAQFHDAFEECLLETLKLANSVNQSNPASKLALLRMSSRHRERKVAQRQAAAEALAITALAASEVDGRQPVKLVGMKKVTQRGFIEGDEANFDEMAEDFAKANPHGEKYLHDLNNIFEHVKSGIDVARGQTHGIKKMNFGVTLGDKNFDVWEFKPLQASGFSLSTQRAKKFRMFFIRHEDNTFGVLKIFNRDDTNSVIRSLGYGTMANSR